MKEDKSLDPPDDKSNITKEGVSYDYSSTIKNGDESQQIRTEHIKSIEEKQDMPNKLFDEAKTNNFIISDDHASSEHVNLQPKTVASVEDFFYDDPSLPWQSLPEHSRTKPLLSYHW